jgi:uncharacterized protein (TIGR02996 family)
MSWELVARLREVCGEPVCGSWLTKEEMSRAVEECRVMETHVASNFGDSEATFGFARRWGVTSEGEIAGGYIVFPRTIPPELRSGASWVWEEGDEVMDAFGLGKLPKAPPAPQPPRAGTMPDELLSAVLAAPDDDAPRRVLADALLERGDPRGEFINVQCELAAGRGGDRFLHAEARLLDEHRAAWLAELGWEDLCATFRRGFVEHVAVSMWLERLGEGWRRTPLRSVTTTGALVEALTGHAVWPRLVTLTVESARVSTRGLEALASGALRVLRFFNAGDDDRPADFVSKLSLHTLELREMRLGERGLQRLLEGPVGKTLRVLELHQPLTFGASATLLAAAAPPDLAGLTLFEDHLHDEHVRELAASPRLSGLVRLDLSLNKISDDGARAIIESPHLQSLEELRLSYNEISDQCALRFADPATLPKLKRLELRVVSKFPRARAALEARFGAELVIQT